MQALRFYLIFSVMIFGGMTAAYADTVTMPAGSAPLPAASAPVARPGRGMSMAAVESRFGLPQQRMAAIGDPPITRWVYPDFTVYFEYQLVIHAVAHR